MGVPTQTALAVLITCMSVATRLEARPDTLSLYFSFNKSTLDYEAIQKLDAAIHALGPDKRQNVRIVGYADEVGKSDYNRRLSILRAQHVKTRLLQSGFRPDDIVLLTGKGEIGAAATGSPDGHAEDRRVDVIFLGTTAPVHPARSPIQRSMSNTDLGTLTVGETILLDNIYFNPGRHTLLDDSKETLDALYRALVAFPRLRIRIEGHVCCIPTTAKDARDQGPTGGYLSLNRAAAIWGYLITKGIDKRRLEYAGFGHSRPLVPEEVTEADKAMNRRVEIRIIP